MENNQNKFKWFVFLVATVLYILSSVYHHWFTVAFNALVALMFIFNASKTKQSWYWVAGVIFGILAFLGLWKGLH